MQTELKKALWAMGIAAALFAAVYVFKTHFIIIATLCIWLAWLIVKDRDKIIIADDILMDENILIKEENKLKTKDNHKLKTRLQEIEYDYTQLFKLYSKRESLNGTLALFDNGDLNKLEEKYEHHFNKTLTVITLNDLEKLIKAHNLMLRSVKQAS
jgi:hypothetical protein